MARPPSLTASQTRVIPSRFPRQEDLKQTSPAVTGSYLLKQTCLSFFLSPLSLCVCCQMGDTGGAFTGAQGWAVVLALSGRASN